MPSYIIISKIDDTSRDYVVQVIYNDLIIPILITRYPTYILL